MTSEKTSHSVSEEGNQKSNIMTKTKTNHPLKARLFIGGLKSLFGDMHDMLEEVEKTGQMSRDMITSLTDVHEAIDLAVDELKKVMSPCCDHSPDAHLCDDSCGAETTPDKSDDVGGSPTQPPEAPEAFTIDEDEEDDQEPVEEIQGQGKGSWGDSIVKAFGQLPGVKLNHKEGTALYEAHPTRKGWLIRNLNGVKTSGVMANGLFVIPDCDACGCDGYCEGEWDLCSVCGCKGNCHPESERFSPPSLRGPSPSDFSSMKMDPEDIPYDSKRHVRVIRHNTPSGTFPTEEDFDKQPAHWRGIVSEHPLSNIVPVDDPLGEKEEDDGKGVVLPAEKKQRKNKSKTKK